MMRTIGRDVQDPHAILIEPDGAGAHFFGRVETAQDDGETWRYRVVCQLMTCGYGLAFDHSDAHGSRREAEREGLNRLLALAQEDLAKLVTYGSDRDRAAARRMISGIVMRLDNRPGDPPMIPLVADAPPPEPKPQVLPKLAPAEPNWGGLFA